MNIAIFYQKIHTRATRLSSISDQHKSAIADHVASTNGGKIQKSFTGRATNLHVGLESQSGSGAEETKVMNNKGECRL